MEMGEPARAEAAASQTEYAYEPLDLKQTSSRAAYANERKSDLRN